VISTTTIWPCAAPSSPKLRDDDLLGEALVVGHDEADAAFHVEASDHVAIAPLEDLDHRAFAPAAVIDAGHAHHRAIAVHQGAHLTRRQEQVVGAVVGLEEAETVGVTDDAPGNEVGLVDDAVAAAPVADQLAVALHRRQPARQGVELLGILQLQPLGDAVELERRGLLGEHLDDVLPTRYRVGVLRASRAW